MRSGNPVAITGTDRVRDSGRPATDGIGVAGSTALRLAAGGFAVAVRGAAALRLAATRLAGAQRASAGAVRRRGPGPQRLPVYEALTPGDVSTQRRAGVPVK